MHSENGILGVGPAPGANEVDPDLINAGKQPITLVTGGSYVHHTDSFLMIRGGHLDLALLGAFEVAENGDLANWTTDDPGFPPGVGGAMDLAVGAKEIRVLVEHTTKSGAPRIRRRCEYPLTAAAAVRRIYTDLAVIDVTADGLVVREIADDIDFADTAGQDRSHSSPRPRPPPAARPAGLVRRFLISVCMDHAATASTIAVRRRLQRTSVSHIEAEMHDVAVVDDVVGAFEAHLAGVLGALLAAVRDEILVGDGLGADEALLEIGVDARRPPAAPWCRARRSRHAPPSARR